MQRSNHKGRLIASLLTVTLAGFGAVGLTGAPATSAPRTGVPDVASRDDDGTDHNIEKKIAKASKKLREEVKAKSVRRHLQKFQDIGTANGGTRASGTSGFLESRDYIVSQLEDAGYEPTIQAFEFPFFRELSPSTLDQVSPTATSYVNPADFSTMTYSGPGDVTAAVVPVDTTLTASDGSTSGCEAADFAGFPAGSIALMQRGTCTFGTKATNAKAAGAVAAIIFNRGTPGATGSIAGTLGAPVAIPAIGASFATGVDLGDPAGTTVRLVTNTESEIRTTWNVFAETEKGDPNNVVMVGAHLDSVVAGPGDNDNGSGSAAILEIAKQLEEVRKPANKVRFAWWGAEELGLLGSNHYINDLKNNAPTELDKIRLYLNFDMVASPNFVRFIYDGDNSAFPVGPGSALGPAGSGQIEKMFADYFASQGLPSAETPFSGRSDYGPFIAAGVDIPAGGLFTGAEGVKTAEQAAIFGGEAGIAYDKCYHQACDTIDNINMTAVDQMSDAIAHSVITYALSTKSLDVAPPAPGRTVKAPKRFPHGKAHRAELHPHHDVRRVM